MLTGAIRSEKDTGSIPFLKWAGGKRWLAPTFWPTDQVFSGKYFEPFLGGGAVFFALRPRRAVLSDVNIDLIETYRCIRDLPDAFLKLLDEHARKHSTAYYYEVRAQQPRTLPARAARFVYLNRTCWNGLYRVNKSGKFNVPIGTKDAVHLPSDDWNRTAECLAGAALLAQDFEQTIESAMAGDTVFADPPYTVKHNLNGFLKYNESIFSWEDQVRLSRVLHRAATRGVRVFSTNAAHASVRALYRDPFTVTTVARASVLAADASARGRYEELLITANNE